MVTMTGRLKISSRNTIKNFFLYIYRNFHLRLGQIDLEKTDLEQQLQELQTKRTEIFENWKKTQQEESNLLNSLSQKYGDGSLSLKDGTFKPIVKQ